MERIIECQWLELNWILIDLYKHPINLRILLNQRNNNEKKIHSFNGFDKFYVQLLLLNFRNKSPFWIWVRVVADSMLEFRMYIVCECGWVCIIYIYARLMYVHIVFIKTLLLLLSLLFVLILKISNCTHFWLTQHPLINSNVCPIISWFCQFSSLTYHINITLHIFSFH